VVAATASSLPRQASAPCGVIARALSGNHWSQQMPAPRRAYAVSHTRKRVSPREKWNCHASGMWLLR